ncbi:hypothetical protein BD310DRAFT_880532 [Dichomitus squalens]|uniref:Uncharacterized protein n=1 Tax=Dichomitus squalens TaxID=114155 RepID=A0A4Q9PT83_9APHY|nr:hypothetical protein BD310DRAFT_880532 [Dichomitus squalens]
MVLTWLPYLGDLEPYCTPLIPTFPPFNMADSNAVLLAQINKGGTIGVGYLGVVASSMVYGVTCIQTLQYYRSERAKTDGFWLHGIVRVESLILDSIQSAFAIHVFYFYLIDNYANPLGLLINIWWAVNLDSLFFTFRVWRLSRNAFVSGFCIFPPACAYICANLFGKYMVGTCICRLLFSNLYEAESKLEHLGAAGLSLEAAADLIVSAALIYYLYKGRTGMPRLNSREYMRQGTSSGKVLSASMTDPRMIPLSTLRVPTERCADRGATSNVIEVSRNGIRPQTCEV